MSPIYDMDAINNAPDEIGKRPGMYRVKIANANDKPSQAGNPMASFELIDVSDGRRLCFDRMMFKGKPFALTLTKKKLQALGVDVSKALEASDLNGLMCWVYVGFGKPNDKGRSYLQPMQHEDSVSGYYPDGPEAPGSPENQAATLIEGGAYDLTLPKGRTKPWPEGVTKATDLPQDHPDWSPF